MRDFHVCIHLYYLLAMHCLDLFGARTSKARALTTFGSSHNRVTAGLYDSLFMSRLLSP